MMTQGQKLSTEKAAGFHTNPFSPQQYCIVRPAGVAGTEGWGSGGAEGAASSYILMRRQ